MASTTMSSFVILPSLNNEELDIVANLWSSNAGGNQNVNPVQSGFGTAIAKKLLAPDGVPGGSVVYNNESRSPIHAYNTWWVSQKLNIVDMKKASKSSKDSEIKLGDGTVIPIDKLTAQFFVKYIEGLEKSEQKKTINQIQRTERAFMKVLGQAHEG